MKIDANDKVQDYLRISKLEYVYVMVKVKKYNVDFF